MDLLSLKNGILETFLSVCIYMCVCVCVCVYIYIYESVSFLLVASFFPIIVDVYIVSFFP